MPRFGGGGFHGGGGYRGGYGGYRGGYGYGYPALAGGLLLGTALGASLAAPSYYYPYYDDDDYEY